MFHNPSVFKGSKASARGEDCSNVPLSLLRSATIIIYHSIAHNSRNILVLGIVTYHASQLWVTVPHDAY